MRSVLKALAVGVILAASIVPAPTARAAQPSYIRPGQVWGNTIGNCGYAIQFGQYGSAAYAYTLNYGSGSGCQEFTTYVYTTNPDVWGVDPVFNPPSNQWTGDYVTGTFTHADFEIRASNGCWISFSYNYQGQLYGSHTNCG